MNMQNQKIDIAVIDYGMGNLHSVASALHKVAPKASIAVTSDAKQIESAGRIIFPGVGAMRDCMSEILRLGIDGIIQDAIQNGRPILAICVGMQALLESSEENSGVKCLAHFKGEVKGFAQNADFSRKKDESAASFERLKVPHMGWNQVSQKHSHPLWDGIEDQSRFYFVHSYYAQLENPDDVFGQCHYGIDFSAAIARKNIFATQFHPEKSHDNGLRLLQNFVAWDGTV